MHDDLFATLNLVSSLMYEGSKGIGHLILVDPKNDVVEFMVKFAEPVTLHEPRWVRKVYRWRLQVLVLLRTASASMDWGDLRNGMIPVTKMHFSRLLSTTITGSCVVAIKHYFRSHYAEPKLPQEPFDKAAFLANYASTLFQKHHMKMD